MKYRARIYFTAIALLLLLPFGLQAADEPNKVDMWTVHVKAGHQPAFETALKTHLAHRAEIGDPRSWQVYSPVTGSDLNTYLLRACCHTWADNDTYQTWSEEKNPIEDWMANVDQHVEGYAHSISTMDFENSNWPEDDAAVNYVGVTDFMIKPGHRGGFEASKAVLSNHLKAGNWPRRWGWGDTVNGPDVAFVASAYADYASMAPPEKGFMAVIAEQMGSPEDAQAALGEFMSHVDSTDYQIYRWHSDLSSPPAAEEVAQN